MTENKPVSDEPVSSGTQPISLQPFAIQLQDVFAIEIVAKRFPVDNSSDTQINTNINIVGLNIDPASFQAQVIIMEVTELTFSIDLPLKSFYNKTTT